jgi:hypothetical protein
VALGHLESSGFAEISASMTADTFHFRSHLMTCQRRLFGAPISQLLMTCCYCKSHVHIKHNQLSAWPSNDDLERKRARPTLSASNHYKSIKSSPFFIDKLQLITAPSG